MSKENDITNYDFDKDGDIDNTDVDIAKLKYAEERDNRKQIHQRKMAYISIIAMVVFTIVLFLPIIPDARIKLLNDIISMFYITQAGIVGAFMGVSAWLNMKR